MSIDTVFAFSGATGTGRTVHGHRAMDATSPQHDGEQPRRGEAP